MTEVLRSPAASVVGSKITSELLCVSCCQLLNEPVALACEHHVCLACARSLFAAAGLPGKDARSSGNVKLDTTVAGLQAHKGDGSVSAGPAMLPHGSMVWLALPQQLNALEVQTHKTSGSKVPDTQSSLVQALDDAVSAADVIVRIGHELVCPKDTASTLRRRGVRVKEAPR